MKPVALKSRPRDGRGKGAAREARRDGMIPAVVYGPKLDTQSIEVDGREFGRFMRDYGASTLVSLSVRGEGEPVVALLREVQRTPVGHHVQHVDFYAVVLDETVQVTVPIEFIGEPAGIEEGGIAEYQMRDLPIECLPLSMPSSLSVDISGLHLGENISAGQVELPEGIALNCDPEETLVTVSLPTMIEEAEEEAEEIEGELPEGEEGEEGEEAAEAEAEAADAETAAE